MADEFFSGLVRSDKDREWMAAEARSYAAPLSPLEYPPEFDPRPFLTVEDQRSRNSCVGNSLASVGEGCGQIDSGFKFTTQFSRWGAYIWSQQMGGMGGRDNGAMISGGVRAATEIGFCPESLWKYPADNEKYSTKEPPGAREAAAPFKMMQHVAIRSYDTGFEFQNQGRGLLWLGSDWTTGMASNKGTITMSDLRSRVVGGHAYYIWGWDKDGLFLVWNSHSLSWGDRGCRKITPEGVNWLASRGEMYGMSDLKDVTQSRPVIVDYGENW